MSGRRAKRERRRRRAELIVDLYGQLEREKLALQVETAADRRRRSAQWWLSQRRPPCP